MHFLKELSEIYPNALLAGYLNSSLKDFLKYIIAERISAEIPRDFFTEIQ